jgi:hypothetical protein
MDVLERSSQTRAWRVIKSHVPPDGYLLPQSNHAPPPIVVMAMGESSTAAAGKAITGNTAGAGTVYELPWCRSISRFERAC